MILERGSEAPFFCYLWCMKKLVFILPVILILFAGCKKDKKWFYKSYYVDEFNEQGDWEFEEYVPSCCGTATANIVDGKLILSAHQDGSCPSASANITPERVNAREVSRLKINLYGLKYSTLQMGSSYMYFGLLCKQQCYSSEYS